MISVFVSCLKEQNKEILNHYMISVEFFLSSVKIPKREILYENLRLTWSFHVRTCSKPSAQIAAFPRTWTSTMIKRFTTSVFWCTLKRQLLIFYFLCQPSLVIFLRKTVHVNDLQCLLQETIPFKHFMHKWHTLSFAQGN